MITLTAQIEAELAKPRTRFIELYRVNLGTVNSQTYDYYWSTMQVPASISFDSRDYEARITRDGLSKLPRGRKDSVTLEILNHDGLITGLYDLGVSLIQGRVSVVRIFPDLAKAVQNIGDWTNPYWHGRIVEVGALTRDTVEVKCQFGYLDLSRRFGRSLLDSCAHLFADGFYCPYKPVDGYGRPVGTVTGTATGGNATQLLASGVPMTGLVAGDICLASNGTDVAVGLIQSVSTGVINVDQWRKGGPPASGWHFQAGKPYTACDYTMGACQDRGMYGPSTPSPDNRLNWSRRRYFGGWTDPVQDSVRVREKKWHGMKFHEYHTLPGANSSMYGEPIRIPVGHCMIRELRPVAWLPAGEYTHLYFIVGEARVGQIAPMSIRINGQPIDNIGRTTQGLKDDSLVMWGFDLPSWQGGGRDDDAVSNGELTEAQRVQGVGIRDAWAYQQHAALSTYKENPFRFNNTSGDGIGPMNSAAIRVRVQAPVDPESVSIDLLVTNGTLMRRYDGSYTSAPDVGDVALTACTNKLWGAGLSPDQIDLDSVQALSAWCREPVPKVQTEWTNNLKTGVVSWGPADGRSPIQHPGKSWIYVAMTEQPDVYVGGELTVTINSVEHYRKIVYAQPEIVVSTPAPIFDPGGQYGEFEEPVASVIGAFLWVDEPWDQLAVPKAGNSYSIKPTLDGQNRVSRYTANGILNTEQKSFDEALDDILRCANAEWFQHLGKIYFAARKQVDLAWVDQNMPVMTDKGTNRNVIIRNGRSTATLKEDKADRGFNAVQVRYVDRAREFTSTTVIIKDRSAQLEQKNRFGDEIKDETKGSVYYPLINNLEEAVRLGHQHARQKGIRADGRRNFTVEVEMPAQIAAKLQPIVDVCPLDLDGFPAFVEYGRVEEIDENLDSLTAKVQLSVYHHDDHSDNAFNVHRDRYPGEIVDGRGNPVRFKIEHVTETLRQDPVGGIHPELDILFTLPEG